MNKPLLSIVTTNKNDQYFENQLLRTKFIINYFVYSTKKMNAVNKVEYIIVDWGSDEPFSNYFHKEISMCPSLKFINVPREETEKCKLRFDTTKATNIGIKKSTGEYIMITGSDQFFPLSVFNNLLNILEKPEIYGLKGNEYKLVPRKSLEDDFFIYDLDMDNIDQYFQQLSNSMLFSHDFYMNDGSGAGGLILEKKQWFQIGGLKDSDEHNRGQDLVIFHETSGICKHIDTATFGSFLLKLPRTKSIIRKEKMKKVKNPLDYLQFDKNETLINYNNLEIASILNPPRKKLEFHIKPTFETRKDITALKIINAVIQCSIFTVFSEINLSSQDIRFILKMVSLIKTYKLKNIILDEKQSKRFLSYISKNIPDIKIVVLTNPKKHTPLELLKFRNDIACRAKLNGHYGHITVTNSNDLNSRNMMKLENYCIVQDFTIETEEPLFSEKKLKLPKINAIRTLGNNKRSVMYNIEDECYTNKRIKTKFKSDVFLNIIIYIFKILFKIKRFLGNIRRMIMS